MSSDLRQYAPATARNREPIYQVLSKILPMQGVVLEIASGTGEHSVYFAPQFPQLQWLPSDANPTAIASIRAWQAHASIENSLAPILINVMESDWWVPVQQHLAKQQLELTAIININMIHISPWEATLGLFAGCQSLLKSGGVLYLYGPYKQRGKHTALSNEQFDDSLQSRDFRWGVRNMEDVIDVAQKNHFTFRESTPMPANNFSLLFERTL